MKNEPFVIERTFNAPVEKIWRAITDRNEMKKWYFDIPDFRLERGHEFEFTVEHEGNRFVHLCKVLEVVKEKKFSHSWRYEGVEGNSVVTWELFGEGNKTRVKLTHEGLETFPPLQQYKRENFEGGWTSILDSSLKKYLEGAGVGAS